MNLTALRRLVLAGNVAALGFSGWGAWRALEERPRPRDEKEWPKLFPVKAAAAADVSNQGPGPKDEYTAAAGWPQGEKPVKAEATAGPALPPPDPFKTKYELNFVFFGETMMDAIAQLKLKQPNAVGFSIQVGNRIPEDPANSESPPTAWRLDAVTQGGPDPADPKKVLPDTALFRNADTEEEHTLEASLSPGVSLAAAGEGGGGGGGPFRRTAAEGEKPPPDQRPRIRLVKKDPAGTSYEYEVAEEEVEWLGFYSDDEARKISVAPDKDGFVLKAVPKGSRAAEVGFKPEDRVISVNGEKVTSTEQAVVVGKRQYEGGTSTFTVKVQRAGREMNFTFHAPKKKRK